MIAIAKAAADKPATATLIWSVQYYAREAKRDADEFTRSLFGVGAEQLTDKQAWSAIAELFKLGRSSEAHTHPCFECGARVMCHCIEPNEDRLKQCRPCHEGFGRQEYNRTFRHSF
jgi:hypothetical protein